MSCKKCGNPLYCLECEGDLAEEVLNDCAMERQDKFAKGKQEVSK